MLLFCLSMIAFTVKSVVDKFTSIVVISLLERLPGKTMCGIHLVRKIKRVFKDIIVISNIESPVDLP